MRTYEHYEDVEVLGPCSFDGYSRGLSGIGRPTNREVLQAPGINAKD